MIARICRLLSFVVLSLVATATLVAPSHASEGQAAQITAIAEQAMSTYGLRAVIVRVVTDGKVIVTLARGESMTGVPAEPDMHFRNGNVAFAYVATIVLQLSDEQRLSLDDKLAKWRPDLPHADAITLRMLLNMTSGYADYVRDEEFIADFYADPFRQWTPEELVAIGISKPPLFVPGANWGYSHTNYVILGEVIEKTTGMPLAEVMKERIFVPLGLMNTDAPATAEIRPPVLQAFSSERREPLGIAPAIRFYEESTYWNPSWTTAPGAVQTTNIYDMTTTAEGIGGGALLSSEAYEAMVGPSLVGFGETTPECPGCRTLDESFHYGLGTFLAGSWIVQAPLFGGYAATAAYLPSRKIAVAIAITFAESGFDEHGNYGDANQRLFKEIAEYLAPDETP